MVKLYQRCVRAPEKKSLIFFFLLLLSIVANAQTVYKMNNEPISTCDGIFTDSKPKGKYGNDENFVKKFTSVNGSQLEFYFEKFRIEDGYDFLYIYDGSNTSAPQIGEGYSGTSLKDSTITSTGSSLTFKFKSDEIVNKFGWRAYVTCKVDDESCSASETGKLDSDGDDIIDECDLDDDNDGILDIDENGSTITQTFSERVYFTKTYNKNGVFQVQVDFYTLDNSTKISINGQNIVGGIGHNGFSSTGVLTAENNPNDGVQNGDHLLVFNSGNATFTHPWTPNNNGLPRLRILITKTGVEITGTRTVGSAALEPLSLKDGNLITPNFNDGNNTIVVQVPNGNGPDGARGEILITSNANTDTDGDGIINSLDLDSDNDGCLDAIEGAGSFTDADLVDAGGVVTIGADSGAANKNLGNNVDSNGVPVVANGGQDIATAQDADTKNAVCYELLLAPDSASGEQGVAFETPNVLENDTLDGTQPLIGATSGKVAISEEGTWQTGITLDTATGKINVAETVPGGVYNVTYKVCVRGTAPVPLCKTTTVEITVRAQFPDSDADGYTDDIDLDDDNDGILDTDELECTTTTVDPGHLTLVESSGAEDSSTYYTLDDGTDWLIFDIGHVAPAGTKLTLSAWGYDDNALVAESLDKTTWGGGTELGFGELADGGYRAIEYSLKKTTRYLKIKKAQSWSNFDLYFNGEENQTYESFNTQECQDIDTDGDGIVNRLDLDSDGDGCPDAIEGDENVTTDHLENSSMDGGSTDVTLNLGNEVGVTVADRGVPTIVNAGGAADVGSDVGQGKGESVIATTLAIDQQPQNQTVCLGSGATFTATATAFTTTEYAGGHPDYTNGTPEDVTYQWQKAEGSDWVDIPTKNGTAASGAIIPLDLDTQNDMTNNGVKYRVKLTSPSLECPEYSDEVTLTLSEKPNCEITGEDALCPNSIATYSAPAGLDAYAWSVEGATIAGATNQQEVSVTTGGKGATFTLTLTVTNANNCTAECTKTVLVDDSEIPVFEVPTTISFCVNDITEASYRQITVAGKEEDDITPDRPDYYRFEEGYTGLDLTRISDNCCAVDELEIRWKISPASKDRVISGVGQPSNSIGGKELWLDVPDTLPKSSYEAKEYSLVYTVSDCNGNLRIARTRIILKPRPRLTKVD